MRIHHAVILAAGRGQRMMPLTADLPKPMAPYLESTMIAAGISRLASYFENIHVTVGYKGALLSQHVIDCKVSTVLNTDGHGNSWWLYNTLLRYVNEPVYVLTCDNIVELDFDLLDRDYAALGSPMCMVVPVVPIPGLEGDYIHHAEGVVTAISRTLPSDIYCSGIQILNPGRIHASTSGTEDFYTVWQQLIYLKQVRVSSRYPKKWLAVDTLEQLMHLNLEAKRELAADNSRAQ